MAKPPKNEKNSPSKDVSGSMNSIDRFNQGETNAIIITTGESTGTNLAATKATTEALNKVAQRVTDKGGDGLVYYITDGDPDPKATSTLIADMTGCGKTIALIAHLDLSQDEAATLVEQELARANLAEGKLSANVTHALALLIKITQHGPVEGFNLSHLVADPKGLLSASTVTGPRRSRFRNACKRW